MTNIPHTLLTHIPDLRKMGQKLVGIMDEWKCQR